MTHLEQQPLSTLYKHILAKDVYTNAEGWQVVKVAGSELTWHPDFRLYLSTSVPLFLKGRLAKICNFILDFQKKLKKYCCTVVNTKDNKYRAYYI